MNRAFRLLAIAFLLALHAWAGTPESYTGRVVGVTDGDTITVLVNKDEHKVRLQGIDAPERKQDFGTKAKQFASDLVFDKDVRVEVVDRDRYGRDVGIVHLADGRILNQELVKAGMAWWYEEYAPKDDTLNALQTAAKRDRRGLWRDADPVPPWEFRKRKRGAGDTHDQQTSKTTAEGAKKSSAAADPAAASNVHIVFVTPKGTKYHEASCRFARVGTRVSLKEAVSRGYRPCKLCVK